MTRPRPRAQALLIDFDGVVRRFDPAIQRRTEERYGLPPGTVLETALEWTRLIPAVTGHVSRAEWLDGVAGVLADRVGGLDRARTLMAEWDAYRGEVASEALDFVRSVRAAGLPVCLATNATSDLDDDLVALGIADDFDAVANSSRLGAHKPSPEFFAAACDLLGVAPLLCLFVDDEDRNVRGARAAGLSAYRYAPENGFGYARAALGLS